MNQQESAALLESLHFPDPLELSAQRAAEFGRLTPDERIRQLLDLIECGMEMLRQSPKRAAIEELSLKRENEWQRIQRELFSHVV